MFVCTTLFVLIFFTSQSQGVGSYFARYRSEEDSDGKCPPTRGLQRHLPCEDCPSTNAYMKPQNCLSDDDCCTGAYCCLSVCEGITRCFNPVLNIFIDPPVTVAYDNTARQNHTDVASMGRTIQQETIPKIDFIKRLGDQVKGRFVEKPFEFGKGINKEVIPKIEFQKRLGNQTGRGVETPYKFGKSIEKEVIPKIDFQKQQGGQKGRLVQKPFEFGKSIEKEVIPKIDFQKQQGGQKGRLVEKPFEFGKSIEKEVIPKVDFQKQQGGQKGKRIEKPYKFGKSIEKEVIPKIDFQKQQGGQKGRRIEKPYKFGKGIEKEVIPKIDFQKRLGDPKGRTVHKPFEFGKSINKEVIPKIDFQKLHGDDKKGKGIQKPFQFGKSFFKSSTTPPKLLSFKSGRGLKIKRDSNTTGREVDHQTGSDSDHTIAYFKPGKKLSLTKALAFTRNGSRSLGNFSKNYFEYEASQGILESF